MGAGTIGGEGKHIGAVEIIHHFGQMVHGQHEVVVEIIGQPAETVFLAKLTRGFPGRRRHELHHSARARTGNRVLSELGFLADDGVYQSILRTLGADIGLGWQMDGRIGALRQDDAAQSGGLGRPD